MVNFIGTFHGSARDCECVTVWLNRYIRHQIAPVVTNHIHHRAQLIMLNRIGRDFRIGPSPVRLLVSVSTVLPIVLPVFLPFILTTVLMALAGQIFAQSLLGGAQRAGMAYLGVYLGDINEDRAKQLNLAEVRGVVVGKVEAGSPAAVA